MLALLLIACQATQPAGDSGAAPGSGTYVLSPLMNIGESATVLMFDAADGSELWRTEVDAELQWLDARLAPDGQSLYALANDPIHHDGEKSEIYEIDTDGKVLSRQHVPDGHHSFDVVDDDDGNRRFAWLQAVVHDGLDPGMPVVADQVVVQDEQGEPTVLLDVLDVLAFDPGLIRLEPIPFYPGMIDWSHANSIRWNPERQRYILSLALQAAVWEIDASGTVTAAFTSVPNAVSFYERGEAYQQSPFPVYQAEFTRQHGVDLGPDGELRLLSNGDSPTDASYATLYRRENGAIRDQFRAYSPFESDHVAVLGGTSRLPDGGTIVSWGSLSGMQALDADGESLWVIEANEGEVFPSVSVYTDTAATFLTR